MPTTLIFIGMACGALLAAIGLTLWGSPRQVPRLSYAVNAIRLLAGVFLLIGALFAWPLTSISYPIVIAALAALPGIPRQHHSHWSDILLILPILILAGVGLFWGMTSAGIEMETNGLSITVAELAIIACSGLGIRALGQGWKKVIASLPQTDEFTLFAAATYGLLTILTSSTALTNLWQQGAVWQGSIYESRLTGAWLTWSAVWLSPRSPRWLRATLMSVALLLLIILITR